MFSYQMEHPDEHQNVRQLIGKLHERQQNVPVFLLGDREKALAAMDRDLLELVDEFAWILEDTADFIAGRAVAGRRGGPADAWPWPGFGLCWPHEYAQSIISRAAPRRRP